MQTITYYRDRKEFFLEPKQILFFESADDKTYAHTREHIYRVKLRLYVLDAILSPGFIRVSKSALANTSQILSFATLVGTTGVVEFKDSHKRLHISRAFIKALRSALRQRGKE